MLNTLNVNLNTDLKVTRVPELGIKIKSQDINNNLFILRFTDKGKAIELDETYTVEILTKFEKSKSHRLTSATVYRDYARWEFDTSFITQDEKVTNYVYVRKAGSLVVSADANAFAFDVGLSEIDKDAGRVAEVYDENYEKYLDEFKEVADFTAIQQAEADRESAETTRKSNETVRISNEDERKSAEVIRLASEVDRVNAESVRAEFYDGFNGRLGDLESGRVVLKNLVVNGDFSDGVTGWIGTFGISTVDLSVANKILSAPITNDSFGGIRQNTDATYNAGDKIYQKVRYRVTNDDCLTIRFSNGGTVSGGETNIVNSNVSENVWYEQSHLRTLGTGSGHLFLQILHYYVDIATAKNKVLETDYIMGINLTQIFGAGNEPTKAEMDELIKITGYFDEITLTQKQLLNWQLKLMRQNRNALIALGGTII